MNGLLFDEFDDGQVVFTGPGEAVGIFNRVCVQGVQHSDGSVRDLDVVINDHDGCEALRIPVSQLDDYVESLLRQKAFALAAKRELESGESA